MSLAARALRFYGMLHRHRTLADCLPFDGALTLLLVVGVFLVLTGC